MEDALLTVFRKWLRIGIHRGRLTNTFLEEAELLGVLLLVVLAEALLVQVDAVAVAAV